MTFVEWHTGQPRGQFLEVSYSLSKQRMVMKKLSFSCLQGAWNPPASPSREQELTFEQEWKQEEFVSFKTCFSPRGYFLWRSKKFKCLRPKAVIPFITPLADLSRITAGHRTPYNHIHYIPHILRSFWQKNSQNWGRRCLFGLFFIVPCFRAQICGPLKATVKISTNWDRRVHAIFICLPIF